MILKLYFVIIRSPFARVRYLFVKWKGVSLLFFSVAPLEARDKHTNSSFFTSALSRGFSPSLADVDTYVNLFGRTIFGHVYLSI